MAYTVHTQMYLVCTLVVLVCTWYVLLLLRTASASETCLTGFQGVLRDANMLVPDAQQPPVDQDSDRGDN